MVTNHVVCWHLFLIILLLIHRFIVSLSSFVPGVSLRSPLATKLLPLRGCSRKKFNILGAFRHIHFFCLLPFAYCLLPIALFDENHGVVHVLSLVEYGFAEGGPFVGFIDALAEGDVLGEGDHVVADLVTASE